jgi:hypothetical protein
MLRHAADRDVHAAPGWLLNAIHGFDPGALALGCSC